MFLREWFEKSREAVTSPTRFYTELDLETGYRYALKFLAVSTFLFGMSLGAISFALNISSPGTALVNFAFVTLMFSVLAFIVSLVNMMIAHLILHMAGARRRLDTTIEVMAYPSALTVLGWVPLLNILLGIYYIYVSSKGLKEFQDVSGAAAAAAVIVANVTGWIVALFAMIVLIAALGGIIGGMSALTST